MIPELLDWQIPQWNQLLALMERSRLPHGLMLAGPSETGKHRFARSFAQLLLCHSPVEGKPCDACKACLLFRASTHPDYLSVEPEESGKAIKVDQVRSLGEFATKTASMGARRVILVSPAESMNLNAANAFLKTLEEPGPGVILLLVVHQLGLILPTIRSRCRLLPFHLPRGEQTYKWLSSSGANSADIRQVMALSGGRPFRARRLLETELKDQLALFQQTLDALEARKIAPLDAAKIVQSMPKEDVIEWFQYKVYAKIKSETGRAPALTRILFKFVDRLTLIRQRFLSSANPNAQLLWEELFMDWKSVIDLRH